MKTTRVAQPDVWTGRSLRSSSVTNLKGVQNATKNTHKTTTYAEVAYEKVVCITHNSYDNISSSDYRQKLSSRTVFLRGEIHSHSGQPRDTGGRNDSFDTLCNLRGVKTFRRCVGPADTKNGTVPKTGHLLRSSHCGSDIFFGTAPFTHLVFPETYCKTHFTLRNADSKNDLAEHQTFDKNALDA